MAAWRRFHDHPRRVVKGIDIVYDNPRRVSSVRFDPVEGNLALALR